MRIHSGLSPWLNRVYEVVGALRIYPEIWRIGRAYPELFRRFKVWSTISLLVLAVFIALDPVKALVLFIVPMPAEVRSVS